MHIETTLANSIYMSGESDYSFLYTPTTPISRKTYYGQNEKSMLSSPYIPSDSGLSPFMSMSSTEILSPPETVGSEYLRSPPGVFQFSPESSKGLSPIKTNLIKKNTILNLETAHLHRTQNDAASEFGLNSGLQSFTMVSENIHGDQYCSYTSPIKKSQELKSAQSTGFQRNTQLVSSNISPTPPTRKNSFRELIGMSVGENSILDTAVPKKQTSLFGRQLATGFSENQDKNFKHLKLVTNSVSFSITDGGRAIVSSSSSTVPVSCSVDINNDDIRENNNDEDKEENATKNQPSPSDDAITALKEVIARKTKVAQENYDKLNRISKQPPKIRKVSSRKNLKKSFPTSPRSLTPSPNPTLSSLPVSEPRTEYMSVSPSTYISSAPPTPCSTIIPSYSQPNLPSLFTEQAPLIAQSFTLQSSKSAPLESQLIDTQPQPLPLMQLPVEQNSARYFLQHPQATYMPSQSAAFLMHQPSFVPNGAIGSAPQPEVAYYNYPYLPPNQFYPSTPIAYYSNETARHQEVMYHAPFPLQH